MYVLNHFLQQHSIEVTPGKETALLQLIPKRENVEQIVAYTRLPVKRRCTQTQLEDYPDSDLFALVKPYHPTNPWRLLAIINCKVDFHSRETEVAFHGLSVRTSSYVKYVCATEDRNIYNGRRPRSELGKSCQLSTKARRLLESYTDRVYIAKSYSGPGDSRLQQDLALMERDLDSRGKGGPFFDEPTVAGHTNYCHLVRPLDDLISDLSRWKEEIPPAL